MHADNNISFGWISFPFSKEVCKFINSIYSMVRFGSGNAFLPCFRFPTFLGGVCNETPEENRNISMFECQFSMFLSSLNDWFHLLLYGVTGEQMTWSCVMEASAGLNSCASWFKENLGDFFGHQKWSILNGRLRTFISL